MATLKNSVFISLHFRRLGVSRKINKDRVETTANKNLVTLSKRLFKSDTYQRITRIQNQARSYVLSRAIETGLRGAVYALPTAFVSEVEDKLSEYVEAMKNEVATLCGEWPELIEVTAREQLGDLYRESDYPTVGQVAQSFGIEWSYLATDVPGELADISSGVFKREREKLEKEFEKATQYTKAIMRRTCLEFVTAFHGQLQPVDPTAKKKRPIHSTTLNKLVDFMETFSVRNISGDEQMVEAITTMKSLLSGVTVNQLRGSESFRVCIESHISDAVLDIGKLVEDCPVRQIILDD